MRKQSELTENFSCLNKAKDDELIFVLLGRDITAPAVIRYWVGERVRLGKNTRSDMQILDALALADSMEAESRLPRQHTVSACKRCFGRHWLFMGPAAILHPCPDCNANGHYVVNRETIHLLANPDAGLPCPVDHAIINHGKCCFSCGKIILHVSEDYFRP